MKKISLIILLVAVSYSFGQRKSLVTDTPKDKYENVFYKKSGYNPTPTELEVDVAKVSFTISHDEIKSQPVYVISILGKSKDPKQNFTGFMYYPKTLEEFMYFKDGILNGAYSKIQLNDNRYKSGGKTYNIKSISLEY
ncbi:hypothetical protein DFQ05_0245 [Winogradskyella wandonensis]|uniref:Uncharacterized protein n=1 Tax=Winogradskyella wandonensis TaxID=1442586 RepID=A0A4R1KU50_9FLAO|nr:hypothetical protein [Winogradskyella wandonensis]TCK68735.1 hypothetical protein DFQ05_0245 [Winogradskyella wandonensis]